MQGELAVDLAATSRRKVTGYALMPPTNPSIYELSGVEGLLTLIIADVRDFDRLKAAMQKAAPEIVIHMAACFQVFTTGLQHHVTASFRLPVT